ncbi:nickel/cobalt transporter [Camelimonas abortus]|uniref:Nickel/cobalt efflux system n=1 Tax=Camelimonas abortus TaxID=1017184 RepID=A0ABV7LE81_9HYPH
MSVTSMKTRAGGTATAGWREPALRAALPGAAVALVLLALGGLALLLPDQAAAPAARNPFGAGMREPVASGGAGAVIAAMQSAFYRALTGGLQQAAHDGAGLWTHGFWSLMGVGFAYGVFHAAGPGHGKAVISGYLVANERALARGAALCWAAALLQAVVAAAIALGFALVFNATAATVKAGATLAETASFAVVAALGALLAWRKAGTLARLLQGQAPPAAAADACCEGGCGHVHMPGAEAAARARDWRAMAAVVLAAGLRPCSGALIVLAFALSQKALAAGVAATFAMAAGTAVTTTAIAALAVFAKRMALAFAAGGSLAGARVMAALELLAAGALLLAGAPGVIAG